MKKAILLLLIVLVTPALINAQSKKQIKLASQYLEQYQKDQKIGTLQKLGDYVLEIFKNKEAANNLQAKIIRGNVHIEMVNYTLKHPTSKLSDNLIIMDLATVAYSDFKFANEETKKRAEKKAVIDGFKKLEHTLNDVALYCHKAKDLNRAFLNFELSIATHKILKDQCETSRLNSAQLLENQYFDAIGIGYLAKEFKRVTPLLKEMIQLGYDNDVLVYELLYDVLSREENPTAEKYLLMGRTKFPMNDNLFFSEINLHWSKGNFDKSLQMLETAVKKDPKNVSKHLMLSGAYEELSKGFRKSGKITLADEYFNKAIQYYQEAEQKLPNNFDILYNFGATYYNRAARMTDQMNAFANDSSPEGTQKYNAIKAEMNSYFQKALPYFLSAEKIKPMDVNTLTALTEIYTSTNQEALAILTKRSKEIALEKKAISSKNK